MYYDLHALCLSQTGSFYLHKEEIFFLEIPLHVGMELQKHGNKVEMKTQKNTNVIQRDGEERQVYST